MQHASPPHCTCAHGLVRPVSRGRFLRGAAALLALGALAPVAEAADEVHWGYEDEVGPESWARLSPEFAVCGSGVRQSPVDIPPTAPLNPADLAFDYKPSALNVVNNGHTVQVNYDPGSTLRLDGAAYELAQYHFHTRSEHAFGGKLADMELHLVHRGPSGGLAVVGVLLNRGAENPAYAPTMANLPVREGPAQTVPGVRTNAADLLPAQRTYYRYDGSLTTPPCSEGVKWLVMSTPVQISEAQVAAFQRIFATDNRPLQPLNGRPFLVGAQAAQAVTQLPRTGFVVPDARTLAGLGLLATAGGLFLRRGRRGTRRDGAARSRAS
jgi:carbonic anhydrase